VAPTGRNGAGREQQSLDAEVEDADEDGAGADDVAFPDEQATTANSVVAPRTQRPLLIASMVSHVRTVRSS
jgi:hypothetical protein